MNNNSKTPSLNHSNFLQNFEGQQNGQYEYLSDHFEIEKPRVKSGRNTPSRIFSGKLQTH